MTTTKSILRSAILSLAVLLICVTPILISCGGRAALSSMPADELFKLGKEKYNNEKYVRAVELFQKIIYDFPGETMVDTAQYYLALSYFGNEEYILARVEFNRLVNYYPASVFAPHAMFSKAVCLYEAAPKHHGLDQSEIRGAITEFEDFIIDFPESEFMPEVHEYLKLAYNRLALKEYDAAFVYYRMHAYQAARIYFQRVIDEYTTSELAGNSIYLLGEMEFNDHKYADAVTHFSSFLTLYPNHEWAIKGADKVAKAAFRSARAAHETGQPEAASKSLQNFIDNYPESDYVDDAMKLLKKIGEVKPTSQASSEEGS